eukprot:CAMPEP_0114681032 /NCGR_PEP_ID=MMETSP0191-20121206/54899_1 /TAXON_ID=126664 /ORGANISM="Sorites sp." /LENGTH=67 /DNA_ID=CAMNT_0001958763 /DNA_START=1 /DNA_END=201 /DNA_ORIENTATION=-
MSQNISLLFEKDEYIEGYKLTWDIKECNILDFKQKLEIWDNDIDIQYQSWKEWKNWVNQRGKFIGND